MEERKKYIAYGSNLNRQQMKYRCPSAVVIGQGKVEGYELLFRGHEKSAVATIEPKEGASVPVLIWDIGAEDEKNLDHYEGYPVFYGKQDIDVKLEDGTEANIMAYIMSDGYTLGAPSISYLNTITEGYLDVGFDVDILYDAAKKSMLPTDRLELSEGEEEVWTQQHQQ